MRCNPFTVLTFTIQHELQNTTYSTAMWWQLLPHALMVTLSSHSP